MEGGARRDAVNFTQCGSEHKGDGAGLAAVTGTYTHPEEGTIVLDADGTGSITQSCDPVTFTWALEDGTIALSIDGEVLAEAAASGTTLIFRAGDFSGDDPVTFTKE